MSDNNINVTAPIHAATKKGKLAAAKEIFLEGDTQTVENEIQDINSRHNDLSSTVSEHTNQIESNQSQIIANKSAQDEKNASLDANMAKLNTRDDQITELIKGVTATGGASVATAVTYDNTSSNLDAATVQGALDELVTKKVSKEDIAQELGDSKDKVISQFALPFREIESPEFINAIVDAEDHFLFGIQLDGSIEWSNGIPAPIRTKLQEIIIQCQKNNTNLTEALNTAKEELQASITDLQESKVDKEEGMSLIEDEVKECFNVIENEEFIHAVIDSENRLLFAIYRDSGKPYFPLNEMYHVEQNEEFLAIWLDAENHVLMGIRRDGQIIGEINAVNVMKEIVSSLKLDVKTLSDTINSINELNEVSHKSTNIVYKYPCMIIRHAASSYTKFPSNTKTGTMIAALQGIKAIENDIRKTSDGVFVLSHENDMSKGFVYNDGSTIEAHTEYISNHTYKECYDNFKRNIYGGKTRISTLEEQLSVCRQYNIGLLAEMKDVNGNDIEDAISVINICKSYIGYNNFILALGDSSDNYELYKKIREKDKEVTICLIPFNPSQAMSAIDFSAVQNDRGSTIIYIDYSQVLKGSFDELLLECKNKSIPIGVWTVESVDAAIIKNKGNILFICSNLAVDEIRGKEIYSYYSLVNGNVSDSQTTFVNTSIDNTTKSIVVESGGSISFTQQKVKGIDSIIFDLDIEEGSLKLTQERPQVTPYENPIFERGTYRIGFSEGFYSNNVGNRVYTFTALEDTKINILNIIQSIII